MDGPRTDPRANEAIPPWVLATAAWHLRREAHVAAQICERVAREGRDADVREMAGALQRVCYQLANLGVAASPPEARAGWVRRVLRAMVG